ncbi:MAG: S8 family serine peptidase [candidate division WOR-3 bacterium]
MKLILYCALSMFVALSSLFARTQDHYSMGPVYRFEPAAGDEQNYISFSNGYVIDTRHGEPVVPAELRATPPADGQAYHIIQFRGPVRRSWLEQLDRLGIKTIGYLPNYATVAKLSSNDRRVLSELEFVNWIGLFHPAYKIQAGLLDHSGTADIAILVTPGEKPEPVVELITNTGGRVALVSTSPFGTVIQGTVTSWTIPALARLPEVFWVQEWTEPTTANNNCQWVLQSGWRATAPPDTSLAARPVWRNGVRGQGVIMSTTDTGINLGHDMFRDPAMSVTPPGVWPEHRKVVAYKRYGTADVTEGQYHGSHVNGTVAGDDSVTGGTSFYDGMSIKGRLYFVDLTNGTSFVLGNDLWSLWDTVYFGRGLPDSLRPIRQHSGSWGWSNSSGTYLLQDASTDAFAWAYKDFLNIMAAGNEYSTRRIRNPGIAKNVLTVGATQNGSAANAIASFSSRGPTQDGRLKPTVMAPGEGVYSATRTGTNTYQSMDGTSMATPAVSGTIGLLRCYLQEGYYPTGEPVPENRLSYISAALLRSMAIVSCDPNIGSYTPPDNNIGWGRIDADSVLYFAGETRKLLLKDDTSGLATGEYKEEQFLVNSAIPLRVALVWTDTAAAPNANPTLVNNLDLELVSPTGVSYHGNKYSGGQSVPNPTGWDSVNVEECCRVNAPDTGLWTIRVYARNVATAARQPFAWTITGDVTTPPTVIHDAGVRTIFAPVGVIDSGTTVTPQALVVNIGPQAESVAVRFEIIPGYADTQALVINAGGMETLSFNPWQALTIGTFVVRCSTMLAGDVNTGNDLQVDSLEVVPVTGVREGRAVPARLTLGAIQPNPFSGATMVRYGLPGAARVQIQIFSVTGELVRTLVSGEQPAGYHTALWDGTDDHNRSLGYGVFYLRLSSGAVSLTKKLIRTR